MFLNEQQMIDAFVRCLEHPSYGHAVLMQDEFETILMVCDRPTDIEWLEAQHGR